MDLLLKGFETRMNEKAQNTALQQSNIILESINKKHEDNEKKMQQHTKTVQDSIVASAEVIEAQGKYVLDFLGAFECMQYLSDYCIGPRAYDERLEKGKLCFSIH
ncbi:Protein of unknown function [Pyronema omphalodes CBS 100304]|uniref:Uncharacterized protein n=1 Tax=Pyronema omphalodes (strain CBS 100304) TaxID=1076935 RepID=U4L3X3_PYROM|nr:Protein of unknown function [Pyronema omphalodes CBS 100304]